MCSYACLDFTSNTVGGPIYDYYDSLVQLSHPVFLSRSFFMCACALLSFSFCCCCWWGFFIGLFCNTFNFSHNIWRYLKYINEMWTNNMYVDIILFVYSDVLFIWMHNLRVTICTWLLCAILVMFDYIRWFINIKRLMVGGDMIIHISATVYIFCWEQCNRNHSIWSGKRRNFFFQTVVVTIFCGFLFVNWIIRKM